MATAAINVIIIGAGTGGLCLAQGLKRAGIGVGVYERDRTRRDGLQGYRVGIGTVTAFFEDGTSATGDLLVAADGANSRVRRQYLPQARLVDTGLIGITGKTLLTPETRALLPQRMIQGVSMVHGPKGFMCIFHVMQFKWDTAGELKGGIGRSDAELIKAWPGLLYDNSRDYIMWGFAAADHWLPEDVTRIKGAELQQLVLDLTGDWHPNFRRTFALGDPDSSFPLRIRTSEPIPPWPTTNVTLLGDAIHTMTPGRGVGANTALRDARLLTRKLVEARDGRRSLTDAVHAMRPP